MVKQTAQASLEMVKASPGARWAWLMLNNQGSGPNFWCSQGVKRKNLMGQDLDPGHSWKDRWLCSVTPLQKDTPKLKKVHPIHISLTGQLLHKSLEQCCYSSCSGGMHTRMFLCMFYALWWQANHCTWLARSCLCARWAWLWFMLAYSSHVSATKFACSCSPGFLGKRII